MDTGIHGVKDYCFNASDFDLFFSSSSRANYA